MADRFTQGWDEDRHKGIRLGTLWFRESDIDGDISLSPAYDDLDVLSKMDLLQDVIGLLNREYDSLFGDFEKVYTK